MPAARREIRWDEFGALCRDLARAVAPLEPDIVVGIVRGGAIVGCTLSFMLGKEFYPIRLKKTVGGATRVVVSPSPELKGKHVLLVDDLSESGDTFRIARHELAQVGVKQVTTAALARRTPGY